MSILIQGVDMPRHCDECPMRRFNLAMCQVTGKSTSHHPTGKPMKPGVRPKWCPLAEAPGWIPVTERLPEVTGAYLVTALSFGGRAHTSVAVWLDNQWVFDLSVIAWMPIQKPEPYVEGKR